MSKSNNSNDSNDITQDVVCTTKSNSNTEDINNPSLNLNISLFREWLSKDERELLWNDMDKHIKWYRVKYESSRFQTQCETPCYTTFYGGDPKYQPYVPIPNWLSPLVARVSKQLLEKDLLFNAILVRLYFDGKDEIAWHTDGRKFLGKIPTIGSLSVGAPTTFEMRRMTNCWPCVNGTNTTHDDGIDRNTPIKSWKLNDGDLFAMHGDTQDHWHHRVPKEKGRRPRININFRRILPNQNTTEGGQKKYYKYMVHGDSKQPPHWKYKQLLRKHNSLFSMLSSGSSKSSSSSSSISSSSSSGNSGKSSRSGSSSSGNSSSNNTAPSSSSLKWECPQCTFLNSDSKSKCEICQHQQKILMLPSSSSSTSKWECPQCTFLNSGSKSKCEICQHQHRQTKRNSNNNKKQNVKKKKKTSIVSLFSKQ